MAAFQAALVPACQCGRPKRRGFHRWVRKTPWRKKWQPVLVFSPGESQGQRGLSDYSPRGCKECPNGRAFDQRGHWQPPRMKWQWSPDARHPKAPSLYVSLGSIRDVSAVKARTGFLGLCQSYCLLRRLADTYVSADIWWTNPFENECLCSRIY